MRIVIAGSGRVAEAFARAIATRPEGPLRLAGLCVRTPEHARPLADAVGVPLFTLDTPPEADLILVAVSDRAIAEVAARLPVRARTTVVHTAGAVGIDALSAHPRRGVLYPLMTFSHGIPADFSGIPLFTEANGPEAAEAVDALARALSGRVSALDSAQRARLHLAGVFANNFVNYCYCEGERLLQPLGLPFDLLKPIIAETARKALDAPSPAPLQTGPAIRHDTATLERHLALLADDPALAQLYELINRQIWETSRKI